MQAKTTLATAALALTFATAAAAEPRSATVSYGDLRIEREADARKLLQRIELTARRLCGGPEIRLGRRRVVEICTREAVADAVTNARSPMLAAVHAGDAIAVQLARR
jgi:UrcA family protein